MSDKYKQCGRNDKYPEEILVWKVNDTKNIPEWIIDSCKVKNIIEKEIILDTRNTSTGGIEFIEAGSNAVLFSTKTKEDYACYDPKTKKIFSLTETQLKLLYETK